MKKGNAPSPAAALNAEAPVKSAIPNIPAVAKKAVEDDGVGLEIRIDGAGAFVLQQKRLNLLYNIFSANGVEARKINTLFVDREANSFVIRTVRVTGGVNKKKEDDEWKKYYQHW